MHCKSSVIVAEDSPRDREFLHHGLNDHYCLIVANSANKALELATSQAEPYVISDLQMPHMNGIELARRLWRRQPNARIVFWSNHKDEMYVRAMAKIIPPETVYGYVLKDNTAQILHRAVDAVFHEGQCWIDPNVRPVQARLRRHNDAITDFEYEVLLDVALGLTDNMIGQRRYLSRRGVQNRLQSLYGKLGIDQQTINAANSSEALNMRVRAIAIALQRGLINPFELQHEERKLREWLLLRPEAAAEAALGACAPANCARRRTPAL